MKNKIKQTNRTPIYILITIYYLNAIHFGTHIYIWGNQDKLIASLIGILMCTLFLFDIPAVFNVSLIISAMAYFFTSNILFISHENWSSVVTNYFFVGLINIFIGWKITYYRMSKASLYDKMEDERNDYLNQSTIDELTQLKNRRDFMQSFQRFISHHRPTDKYLCIALLDVDCFKNYNDHYGHPKGDECLREIGKVLNKLQINNNVYTARIGGEEFGMLWHTENISNANDMGEYVSQLIRDLNIPHEKSMVAPYITVSIGIHIAQYDISCDINELYNLTDQSLYNAKKNGRNCIVISS